MTCTIRRYKNIQFVRLLPSGPLSFMRTAFPESEVEISFLLQVVPGISGPPCAEFRNMEFCALGSTGVTSCSSLGSAEFTNMEPCSRGSNREKKSEAVQQNSGPVAAQ
jgi:hypothetical protein